PHPGEMKRLWSGVFREDLPGDRQEQAVQLAQQTKTVVALKGAGTVVTDGEKVTLSAKKGGGVKIQRKKISTPSWQYQVTINEDPTTLDVFELKLV
ncbi:MAG: hypothetical protein HQ596_00510, partial [Candidatus Saganbacteria bacterium]|nr:hypothetical protein [Candidatus Saganbacteria bacterium]